MLSDACGMSYAQKKIDNTFRTPRAGLRRACRTARNCRHRDGRSPNSRCDGARPADTIIRRSKPEATHTSAFGEARASSSSSQDRAWSASTTASPPRTTACLTENRRPRNRRSRSLRSPPIPCAPPGANWRSRPHVAGAAGSTVRRPAGVRERRLAPGSPPTAPPTTWPFAEATETVFDVMQGCGGLRQVTPFIAVSVPPGDDAPNGLDCAPASRDLRRVVRTEPLLEPPNDVSFRDASQALRRLAVRAT